MNEFLTKSFSPSEKGLMDMTSWLNSLRDGGYAVRVVSTTIADRMFTDSYGIGKHETVLIVITTRWKLAPIETDPEVIKKILDGIDEPVIE